MKLGIREIIFFVIMLALLGGSYTLVFKRANEKRAAIRADIEQKTQALANLNHATAGIEDLNHKIEELQQAITFFQSKLPQEKEIDSILKEVWQMAEANALTTKTIKTLNSQRYASYSEQPIQLSLSGDFNGYYAFLLQLEKLPRITRVLQMRLEKINDHQGEMQAQMTLSIFFEPDGDSKTVAATN